LFSEFGGVDEVLVRGSHGRSARFEEEMRMRVSFYRSAFKK